MCSQEKAGTVSEGREEAQIEKPRWAEDVWFGAFKGAQLVFLGSIHSKSNQTAYCRALRVEEGLSKDRAVAGEAKLSRKERKQRGKSSESGWDKACFYDPRRLLTQALIFSSLCIAPMK